VGRAALLSVPFALVVVGKVVAGFQDSSDQGNARIQIVLSVLLVAAAIVLVGAAWIPLEAGLRLRRVAAMRPAFAVLPGQWSQTLATGLPEAGLPALPKYANTYCVSLEPTGIRFWFGLMRLRNGWFVPWSVIRDAQPGMDRDANRVVHTVNITVAGPGGEVAIDLAISRTVRSLGNPDRLELSSLAGEIRDHLGSATTNSVNHAG